MRALHSECTGSAQAVVGAQRASACLHSRPTLTPCSMVRLRTATPSSTCPDAARASLAKSRMARESLPLAIAGAAVGRGALCCRLVRQASCSPKPCVCIGALCVCLLLWCGASPPPRCAPTLRPHARIERLHQLRASGPAPSAGVSVLRLCRHLCRLTGTCEHTASEQVPCEAARLCGTMASLQCTSGPDGALPEAHGDHNVDRAELHAHEPAQEWRERGRCMRVASRVSGAGSLICWEPMAVQAPPTSATVRRLRRGWRGWTPAAAPPRKRCRSRATWAARTPARAASCRKARSAQRKETDAGAQRQVDAALCKGVPQLSCCAAPRRAPSHALA